MSFVSKIKYVLKDSKNKNLVFNIVGTFGIKGVALLISLFSMPIYIRYFDNDIALGVWFSFHSILNWILTFDLGIGNGLRNQLVPELNNGNTVKIKKLISSAYFMLGVVSLVIGALGVIAIRFVDLNAILNVSPDVISSETLFQSVSVVFLAVILKFFLNIITSIFYAMQKTALPNFITLFATISVLVFMSVFNNQSVETKFLLLSYFNLFSMCAPLIVATAVVFLTSLKDAKPSLKSVDWNVGKSVVGLGGKFFVAQICLMLISSTNEILISTLVAPENAVDYQIYNRWFFMIITVFSLLIQPMWSSFSQAHAEGNYSWIKSTYKKFLAIAGFGSAGAVVLAAIFQIVVNIWLREDAITVNFGYGLCFAALITTNLFINSATCVANALNELKCQIIWTVIGAVLKVPLAILFVGLFNSWIGVVLANLIALVPLLIFQTYDINKKLNQLIKNKI